MAVTRGTSSDKEHLLSYAPAVLVLAGARWAGSAAVHGFVALGLQWACVGPLNPLFPSCDLSGRGGDEDPGKGSRPPASQSFRVMFLSLTYSPRL